MKALDLVGRRFGRLTVVARDYDDKGGKSRWFCRCECGKEASPLGASLVNGRTKSCGCWRQEEIGQRSLKHGASRCRDNLPEYQTWQDMRRRCRDETRDDYQWYGARGVQVCDRWNNDFAAFLADMGRKPTHRHSIDRVDNEGDYEPANCRWALSARQARNRRSCRMVNLNGKRISATDAAEKVGMKRQTVLARLRKGWPDQYALSAPMGSTWPPSKA